VENPYRKAALFVLRLIAAGFIILSLCWCLPELFLWTAHHPLKHPVLLALKTVPFVIGLLLYWKGGQIAEQLTKDLD
jgi:hypothetical protein